MIFDYEHTAIIYENIFELNYVVLNAIGLYSDQAGYVYDQDTREPIMVFGKRLKTSIDPNNIKYPGNMDIMMDVLRNNQLMKLLLGYQIEKKVANEEMTYMAQYIDEIKNDPRTAIVIKYDATRSISSGWYNNNCLGYIDIILRLGSIDSIDNTPINIDLLAFDNLVF